MVSHQLDLGKEMKMEIWDLMEMAFDFSRVGDVTFFASQTLLSVEYKLFESFLANTQKMYLSHSGKWMQVAFHLSRSSTFILEPLQEKAGIFMVLLECYK
jgi:hypothetical protein